MSRYSRPDTDLFREADHTIDSRCENLRFAIDRLGEGPARDYYLYSGHLNAANLLSFLARLGRDPRELSLLDFASGYGRTTRYFARRFREVFVSDLDDEMLAFCRVQFGTPGFRAVENPTEVMQVRRRFDVVFSHSLFTGLAESTWIPTFHRLADLVEVGGHLVVTTQGAKFAARLRGADPSSIDKNDGPRFEFVAGNETRGRLSSDRYGTAFVSDGFVRDAAAAFDGLDLVEHFEMGDFDLFHDVYAFARR